MTLVNHQQTTKHVMFVKLIIVLQVKLGFMDQVHVLTVRLKIVEIVKVMLLHVLHVNLDMI